MSSTGWTAICAVALLLLAGAASVAGAASAPWVAKIRKEHPRVFFSPETWPAVRARAAGPEREWFGYVKSRVDKLADSPSRKDWGTEAAAAAFVWRVTGDRKYLDKATKLLEQSVASYPESIRSGKMVSWYSTTRINAWAALDWLWNDLPEAKRKEIGARFLKHVNNVQPGSPHRFRMNRSGPTTGFYGTPSLLWYSGLVLHGEGVDDSAARANLVKGHDLYNEVLKFRARCAGDDGGSASASLNYCLGAYPWAEHNFFYSWLSATGESITAKWPHVTSLADYICWNRLPGGREFGAGDAYHLKNTIGREGLYNHLANIVHFYAAEGPRKAAMTRWMLDNWARRTNWARWTWPAQAFLRTGFEKCPPPIAPGAQLPLARHFENMGQVFMRSGSGEEDTYLLLASGGVVTSHKQYDNNHFALYHRGFLALDTGTRPEPGQHLSHYYCRTVAHNCVTVKMPGEKMGRYWGSPAPGEGTNPVPNDGGQIKPIGSKVVAFETAEAFAYVASDATEAYGPAKCKLALRQIVFVPPVHVVIFDRVTSTKAEYEKRWLWHAAAEPVMDADGGLFSVEHDKGRAICRTLLPEGAKLSKIGGPGKQFWSDGRNWPTPKGWRRNTTDENPLLGQWRVEVRPGKPAQADAFLHLIEVGEKGRLARMGAHELIADSRSPGVKFDAPGGRKVEVRFGVTGPASGHIRIKGGRGGVDRELSRAVQKQTGLAGEPEGTKAPSRRTARPPRRQARPGAPADPLAAHAAMLAEARKVAAAGLYSKAAGMVGKAAADEKAGAARDALERAARGFKATSQMRHWVVEAARDGRQLSVYVDMAGRPTRGKLMTADDDGVTLRVMGNEITMGWAQLSPRRLLGIARKYAPKDGKAALDDFAFAAGLEKD